MNLVLISAAAGLATMLLIFLVIVTFSTLEDLHLRDWLTLWPLQHWLGELKAMFSLNVFAAGAVLLSLVIYCSLRSARAVDALASQGKCTCHCKACKESLRLSRAAAACLGLHAEDIEELSRDHSAETNSVAKPASK